MNKVEYILEDAWLKQKARFWLNAALPANERELIGYGLLDSVAKQYACLTFFDGSDLYLFGHANIEVALVLSRDNSWSNKAMKECHVGNGGIYYVPTPDALRNQLAEHLAGRSEDADNRAAKKSCALH